MPRQEITGKRDLRVNNWVHKFYPNGCDGFTVTDIDLVIQNYKTKRIIFIETKTRNSEKSKFQIILFRNINRWLKQGIDKDWEYLGFYTIKFENTYFDDGKCWLNNIEVTQNELEEFLKLKK